MLRKSVTSAIALSALALSTLVLSSCGKKEEAPEPTTYALETFVPGAPFHGLHGLTFGEDGMIYVGSVVGMSIYKVDPETGEVSLHIGGPTGQADDLEFSAGGGLAWTAFGLGKVFYQTPEGEIRTLAENLPGLNSLAFNAEGRLFATQVFLGDALYELHLSGKFPPRKIMEGMGGLNGFDFGPDGKLYGPIWFKGEVARIDVDDGTMQVVSSGYTVPAAVNFDSKGNLWVIDNETGEVFKVNLENMERTLIATAPSNLDNLAFDKDDRLYISNMSDSAIYEVNTETGELHTVVSGPLSVPAGLDAHEGTLFVADTFNLTKVDIATGEVSDIERRISVHEYPTGVNALNGILTVASANAGMVQTFDIETSAQTSRWTGFILPVQAVNLGDVTAVLEGHGQITLVIGSEGTNRTVLIEGLQDPGGVIFHGGSFYVTEAALGSVSKISLETGEKTLVADGLAAPEGLDIFEDGTLVVAEVGTGTITEIKPDGTRRALATGLELGLSGYAPFPPAYIPTGLTIDEAGVIYVSSDKLNSIYKLVPASGEAG